MREKISLIVLGVLVFLGLANPAVYAGTEPVRDDLGDPATLYDDSWTHSDWTTIHEGYVVLSSSV